MACQTSPSAPTRPVATRNCGHTSHRRSGGHGTSSAGRQSLTLRASVLTRSQPVQNNHPGPIPSFPFPPQPTELYPFNPIPSHPTTPSHSHCMSPHQGWGVRDAARTVDEAAACVWEYLRLEDDLSSFIADPADAILCVRCGTQTEPRSALGWLALGVPWTGWPWACLGLAIQGTGKRKQLVAVTTYCPRLTICYILPGTCYLFFAITHCALRTAHYLLHTTYCVLHTTHCVLHTTYCVLCTVYGSERGSLGGM